MLGAVATLQRRLPSLAIMGFLMLRPWLASGAIIAQTLNVFGAFWALSSRCGFSAWRLSYIENHGSHAKPSTSRQMKVESDYTPSALLAWEHFYVRLYKSFLFSAAFGFDPSLRHYFSLLFNRSCRGTWLVCSILQPFMSRKGTRSFNFLSCGRGTSAAPNFRIQNEILKSSFLSISCLI